MIRLSGVDFGYSGGAPVLRGVDLDVAPGQLMALAGRNGSGKSTLLGLLAGLHAPVQGEVSVNGTGRASHLRRTVSLVLQDAELMILGATVAEDLCLGLARKDGTGLENAKAMAARFGLLNQWDAPVHSLSYGQKRKLSLAAALRDAPAVVCLDEPFAGLDYPAIVEMRSILAANRARGITQVVAAHDVEPLADLADGWAVLQRGALLAAGGREQTFPKLLEAGVRPPCGWLAAQGLAPWPDPTFGPASGPAA